MNALKTNASGTTGSVFASTAPNATLFAGDFKAPRSVRSNVNWNGPVLGNRFNLILWDDVVDMFDGYPGSIVGDGDPDPFLPAGRFVHTGLDRDPAAIATADGVHGVVRQVDEHLLQPTSVQLHEREVVGHIDVEGDGARAQVVRLQSEHAVDERADRGRVPLGRPLAEEGEQVADQTLRPRRFLDEEVRVMSQILRQGWVAPDELAETDDGGERVPELM